LTAGRYRLSADCQPSGRKAVAGARSYAGAGLRLPIARWVAEARGEHLVLESSGPDGSTFTVTLPSPNDPATEDESA